ncbi:MAG TPA: ergothioneine biosynthesis protein EgtB [Cryomorphaceae bacterium]|nr:ergothioneine biosynthesis protein EgtB [Cryomorphaceae bacterium]
MIETKHRVDPRAEDVHIRYKQVRRRSEEIARPLNPEDQVVQPALHVSPPKWHLAHTSWFFETFLLKVHLPGYREFDSRYGFLFNSYYESVGERVNRPRRGLMTRPPVSEILSYRAHVDEAMEALLTTVPFTDDIHRVVEVGLQHEMQHAELMLTDIKYILGHQPFSPVYRESETIDRVEPPDPALRWISVGEGVYEIGATDDATFKFDNEFARHKQYLQEFEIASRPVLFGEYLEFIEDGGYRHHGHWHSDAWDWIRNNGISMPLYMHEKDGRYLRYTLGGEREVNPDEVLLHISFYEAAAFASWKGMRLPTEFEWEAASRFFDYGQCWEWTGSAYLPYPGYRKAPGALGEYNGKFMVNQMVLRGASRATAPEQVRSTYRNFFHPPYRWQLTGIRLVR